MSRCLVGVSGLCLLLGCQISHAKPLTLVSRPLNDQQTLIHHFRQQGYISPKRNLVTLIHVCTLWIAQHAYPVIDLRERVKSPNSPRGLNQIFVLNEKLEKLTAIEYTQSRPLLCKQDKLYLAAELHFSAFAEPGNVITFDANGNARTLELIDVGQWF